MGLCRVAQGEKNSIGSAVAHERWSSKPLPAGTSPKAPRYSDIMERALWKNHAVLAHLYSLRHGSKKKARHIKAPGAEHHASCSSGIFGRPVGACDVHTCLFGGGRSNLERFRLEAAPMLIRTLAKMGNGRVVFHSGV